MVLGDDGKRLSVHNSVPAAKQWSYSFHNQIAVRVYDDNEVEFDGSKPLHLALALIELRHNPYSQVVAVGNNTFLIRRGRWGIDDPIKYKVKDKIAYARKDSEAML